MKRDISLGTIGLSVIGLSHAITLSGVESWLRILSLLVGITVGVLTIVKLSRHKKKGKQE